MKLESATNTKIQINKTLQPKMLRKISGKHKKSSFSLIKVLCSYNYKKTVNTVKTLVNATRNM